jgi:molybdopterin synthase catalytic subunit
MGTSWHSCPPYRVVDVRSWITTDPIDAAVVLQSVGSPADGAIVLFLGTVREENERRPVRGLRYDAYVEMAERVLREIVNGAVTRSGSDRIAVVHRIGELEVGDVSVAIAVSTPHRADAFAAARSVIEEIKERLPVWKQEHYVSGEARWLAGTVPPAGADA